MRIFPLAAAASLACAASATAAPVIAPGIYGNVRVSRETGDLGGIELEIRALGQVETVLCEGWCNETYKSRYRESGGVITYEIRNAQKTSDGRASTDVYAV